MYDVLVRMVGRQFTGVVFQTIPEVEGSPDIMTEEEEGTINDPNPSGNPDEDNP